MEIKYNIKNKKITPYIYFNPLKKLSVIKTLMNEVSNNYKDVMNNIIRLIKSEFFCKKINEDYIIESFREADAVVVISDMDILPNGNIFGFTLINFDERNNSLYIPIFGSHIGIYGAGDILIKELQNIGVFLLFDKIQLESVKESIAFYEKYGFTKEFDYDNLCKMTKIISRQNQ